MGYNVSLPNFFVVFVSFVVGSPMLTPIRAGGNPVRLCILRLPPR